MSSPRTSSGLSEELSTSASNTLAGRRLANSSSSLRSRNRPRSGLFSNARTSYLGPPTAPNSTASASSALAMTSSVMGVP